MQKQALQRLQQRRNPEGRALFEAYERLEEDEPVKYLAGAMEEIPKEYTDKTKEEAARVQNQIVKGLERETLSAEYRLQGSVIKNTHVRGYSDVDVLVLDSRFVTLEHPQVPANPYKGDPLADLKQIRRVCTETLTTSFPAAEVDSSGPKSVKISGGSLNRTVDVVPSNWYDTNDYAQYKLEVFRGVQILNLDTNTRDSDRPFHHAALLDAQDQKANGNLKRLIRLLKSLKYDSTESDTMSSYDIESIAYRLEGSQLAPWSREQAIQVAVVGYQWLETVDKDANLRSGLFVPDARRRIFCDGHATQRQLQVLKDDLGSLLLEINKGLTKTARRLAEARLKFPSPPIQPGVW